MFTWPSFLTFSCSSLENLAFSQSFVFPVHAKVNLLLKGYVILSEAIFHKYSLTRHLRCNLLQKRKPKVKVRLLLGLTEEK